LRIVVLVVFGFIVLGLFLLSAPLLKRTRPQAAALFMRAWFVGALVNAGYGVNAGLAIDKELLAFLPIYGIPAVVAWWLAYGRFRRAAHANDNRAPAKPRSGKTKLGKTRSRL
jgi:hypothetical protein